MLDAEAAARAVLSGQASAEPKTGTSTVEMIRHIKIARDAAVKAKTQAMQTLKSIIVLAPAELREQLEGIRGPITLVATWPRSSESAHLQHPAGLEAEEHDHHAGPTS